MGVLSTLSQLAVEKAIDSMHSEKATLVIGGKNGGKLPVQFNPSEYKITEQTDFSQIPKREDNVPAVSFNGIPLSTLNVKLYFDCDEVTTVSSMVTGAVESLLNSGEKKNITDAIDKISSLTIIDGKTHQPPTVTFVWGALSFGGFATNVVTNYTMFDKKGKPLRATVDLTIKGVSGNVAQQISPKSSPDRTKARNLTEDTNIWQIAENEYGDAREWRRTADANDVMNPLEIPVGKVLKVPSID